MGEELTRCISHSDKSLVPISKTMTAGFMSVVTSPFSRRQRRCLVQSPEAVTGKQWEGHQQGLSPSLVSLPVLFHRFVCLSSNEGTAHMKAQPLHT